MNLPKRMASAAEPAACCSRAITAGGTAHLITSSSGYAFAGGRGCTNAFACNAVRP